MNDFTDETSSEMAIDEAKNVAAEAAQFST